jgi:hypothetical protein
LADALKEYFVSEDLEEMTRSISEMDARFYHYELVKRCVCLIPPVLPPSLPPSLPPPLPPLSPSARLVSSFEAVHTF